MNRRSFLKGFAAAAGAVVLPATLEENAEAGKKIWALGGIPRDPESLGGLQQFLFAPPSGEGLTTDGLMKMMQELYDDIEYNNCQTFEYTWNYRVPNSHLYLLDDSAHEKLIIKGLG